ncbi:TIGR03118 family protein [Pedomonas mirosovicensis]|uniref:TIGR03118 family protein n=1 Tax=Pedomonas mirosovicensis TaxID=2908641 RepID=UPI00216A9B8B|nr:TIGR03118 family protein [Pedomonas mirosovicensis]MCH8684530.1 TIGR03118 family protein [Pedomonas mirosovicensis]
MQPHSLSARLRAWPRRAFVSLALCGASLAAPATIAAPVYNQINLVTDDQEALAAEGHAPARHVDPNLINPWGVAYSPTGPFWVANAGTGTSTLYTGSGEPFPVGNPLVVNIPQNPTPPHGPTGIVFNDTAGFQIPNNGSAGPATFIFSNLDGSLSAWNGSGDPTQAVQVVPPGDAGRPAIYPALAIGSTGGANYLYAPNNITGQIDVFDANFNPATLPGNFVDPNVPAGLVPFNVQNIDGLLYVTYAIPGPQAINADMGMGAVSVFAPDGTYLQTISTGGGLLTSPWGVAIAPEDFGEFSNALLVANFHNEYGYILAYDLETGEELGAMQHADGSLINIAGLWAILFGNGGLGGDPNSLYFAAGLRDELHGLFGEITPFQVPEPGAAFLLLTGLVPLGAFLRRRRQSL